MTEKQEADDAPEATTPDDSGEFEFEDEYEFESWEDIPAEEVSRILKGLEALIPDIVRRSVGNVLSTSEDGLRALVGDKNIPKELAGFLLGQIDATRRGILRIVSNEIKVFLENVDFGGELAKILTTLSFEVRTEIRFIPNDERLKPSVKNTVRVKREKRGDGEPEPEEPSGEAEAAAPAEPDVAPKKPASRWTRRRKSDES